MNLPQDDAIAGSATQYDFIALSRRILHYANRGTSRIPFLRATSHMLLDFSRCDLLEIWLQGQVQYRWAAVRQRSGQIDFEFTSGLEVGTDVQIDTLTRSVLEGDRPEDSTRYCKHGSYWTGNAAEDLGQRPGSLAIMPFVIDEENSGALKLQSHQRGVFSQDTIASYEALAQTLGLAIADRRAQSALRERMRELSCLYGILQIKAQAEHPLEDRLRDIVALIPPAWRSPEAAIARVVLDDTVYATAEFDNVYLLQSAAIVVGDRPRGIVEVAYLENQLTPAERPFLAKDHHFINGIADQIGLLVVQNETLRQKAQLEEQIRHADRLATIGQLAAGVTHEINEPLANILGFAQLARKSSQLPAESARDLDKIIASALQARDITSKLMLFARQTRPCRKPVNLNLVVEEALSMLEARCLKGGVKVVRQLSGTTPELIADPLQLHQILVNLIVNAIQAMPEPGILTIATCDTDDAVTLIVEDSGTGMSTDTHKHLFDPFFTTKQVGEGTGLGLSVVHGIVTAHGGRISVDSEVDRGTRFEVQIPKSDPTGAGRE